MLRVVEYFDKTLKVMTQENDTRENGVNSYYYSCNYSVCISFSF